MILDGAGESGRTGFDWSLSVLAAVLCVLLGHGFYFALGAVPSPYEVALTAGSVSPPLPFDRLAAAVAATQGPPFFSLRLLSLFAATGGALFVHRALLSAGTDRWAAAALPAGFVFFPPTAFAFAQPGPFGFTTLVCALGVYAAWSSRVRRPLYTALLLLAASAGLVAVHPVGLGLALIVLALTAVEMWPCCPRRLAAVLGPPLLIAVLIQLISGFAPSAAIRYQPDLTAMSDTLLAGLIRPYAMIWVALGFSLLALFASAPLRQTLGAAGCRRAWSMMAALVLALVWLKGTAVTAPGLWLMDFNLVLVFAVMAAAPMVVWIRVVMPRIRSMVAWIVLPVVMYSCFWVVLGPVDLDGFPYNLVRFGDGL